MSKKSINIGLSVLASIATIGGFIQWFFNPKEVDRKNTSNFNQTGYVVADVVSMGQQDGITAKIASSDQESGITAEIVNVKDGVFQQTANVMNSQNVQVIQTKDLNLNHEGPMSFNGPISIESKVEDSVGSNFFPAQNDILSRVESNLFQFKERYKTKGLLVRIVADIESSNVIKFSEQLAVMFRKQSIAVELMRAQLLMSQDEKSSIKIHFNPENKQIVSELIEILKPLWVGDVVYEESSEISSNVLVFNFFRNPEFLPNGVAVFPRD